MGFTLFKNGDQLFDEGLDLINRKDFSKSREKFNDAIAKNTSKADLARIYIGLLDLSANRGNPGYYQQVSQMMANTKIASFKFGLTDVESAKLKTECDLAVEEIAASNSKDGYMAKGKALIGVAQKYQSLIADDPLKLDEMFKGTTASTGSRESLILQAMAYETMGKGAVLEDPKQGAEFMQMAYNFRRQLGDSGDEDLGLMKAYSRSAKCWICGRPMSGEGVHFIAAPSTVTPMFKKGSENDIVRSYADDCRSIYICLPCYTAISNRADAISRGYYNQAMSEMKAMEARLEAEIADVRNSVSLMRTR